MDDNTNPELPPDTGIGTAISAYCQARKIVDHIIYYSQLLKCPCTQDGKSVVLHSTDCPIGYALDAVGDLDRFLKRS